MKKGLFAFLIILSLATIIADNPVTLELKSGKNNFTIEEHFPAIQVSNLISKYPQIRSASLTEYGTIYGYANVANGIGTNFIIEPGRTYEIYLSEDINISLKE